MLMWNPASEEGMVKNIWVICQCDVSLMHSTSIRSGFYYKRNRVFVRNLKHKKYPIIYRTIAIYIKKKSKTNLDRKTPL